MVFSMDLKSGIFFINSVFIFHHFCKNLIRQYYQLAFKNAFLKPMEEFVSFIH